MKSCLHCNKEIVDSSNFCGWECIVESAKKEGGKIIAPNNLPICCVDASGDLLEHEHAKNPDYKFPVEVEFIGIKPELPNWDTSYSNEKHAFLYIDDYIITTLHEYNYHFWSLIDGFALSGDSYANNWKLTPISIKKIKSFINDQQKLSC